MIENRRDFRIPFVGRFIFSTKDKVLSGKGLNLSRGGIYVRFLDSPKVSSGSKCSCVFKLNENQAPIKVVGEVKRVVARSIHPETIPGVGFAFATISSEAQNALDGYLNEFRGNLELISTILLAGEPDRLSLQPLVRKVGMEDFTDLGELKFRVENILQSIELVQTSQ